MPRLIQILARLVSHWEHTYHNEYRDLSFFSGKTSLINIFKWEKTPRLMLIKLRNPIKDGKLNLFPAVFPALKSSCGHVITACLSSHCTPTIWIQKAASTDILACFNLFLVFINDLLFIKCRNCHDTRYVKVVIVRTWTRTVSQWRSLDRVCWLCVPEYLPSVLIDLQDLRK